MTLVAICFALAFALTFGGIVWGVANLVRKVRIRRRQHIWDAAASLLAEHPREVEDYVAQSTMDLVEFYDFQRRPEELPPYGRLLEMTRDEALDGMLRWARECVRLNVENTALNNEVHQLRKELDRTELLRARYWRRIKRLSTRIEHLTNEGIL